MADVEDLIKATLGQIEKVLDAKTVIGEPITVGETTLIPLLSIGVGFGAGGATGKEESGGSATAGGAGVKPIAIIVVDKEGVRIEAIKGGMASAIEKLSETLPDVAAKIAEKWGMRKDKAEE